MLESFFFIIIVGISLYVIYRVVTRNKQISAQAEIVNIFLGLIKPKYFLKQVFANPPRSDLPLMASRRFSNKYDTAYHTVDGTEMMTAKLRNTENSTHLIYLHGGAYVLGKNGVKGSEPFISKLIEGTGAKVTYIDYPVAPENKYTETLEQVYKSYNYLNEKYVDEKFILVGDSAGGGLALSLAQIIQRRRSRRPEKLVLFSPWLDLSLENPQIDEQINKDMILSKHVLLYAAEQYAEASEYKNPLVSPIYGDFRELGETIMFFSSFELFYADGLKLKHIAEMNNLDISFQFYTEIPHGWVIFPIPEARYALQDAFEFILD